MSTLPPTEQRNPRTRALDMLGTREILERINDEDATIATAVREALPQITAAADAIVACLRAGGRVFYAGAGTSGRIGALDALEWQPTFGTAPGTVTAVLAGGDRATIESAAEIEDDGGAAARDLHRAGVAAGDVVVAIAASGRTPYALGALRAANAAGATAIALVCNPDTILAREADIAIVVVTGPEALTGSTRMKAGTAQKLVLNMLSTAAMVRLGKVYENLMVDMRPRNAKLRDRAGRMIAEVTGVALTGALAALDAAGGSVKVAIVMLARDCDAAEAARRLEAAGGFVREAMRP